MTPPRSPSHMPVDLVMLREENHATMLFSDTQFQSEVISNNVEDSRCSVPLQSSSMEYSLGENPPSETSVPNIAISSQNMNFDPSGFIRLSNVFSENLIPAHSPIVEFIDRTDEVKAVDDEPNDIILNTTSAIIEPFLSFSEGQKTPPENPQTEVGFLRSSELERIDEDNDQTESVARETQQINLEDPDYIPENNDAEESEVLNQGRPHKGRKRKYPDQNRYIRKRKTNMNEDYISAKGKKVSSRKFKGNLFKCNCPFKCTEKLTVDQCEKEFIRFWSAGSFEARCAILQGSVKEAPKKRSYSTTSKRQYTRTYYLANTKVCKKTFLKTLSISQSRIDVALEKYRSQTALTDNRGKNSGGKNAITPHQLEDIKEFIKSLPKYRSHYCRSNTTAKFLAPNLNLSKVYDLYKEKNQNYVSFSRFRLCFYKEFNLKFKKPQKDTCFRCDRLKASKTGATSEEIELIEKEHREHLDHAYDLRDQMKKDLARAKIDPKIETLTFDLQKTYYLPRLPTSIVYYKRQLNLYNLGIHCGSTGLGFFNVWLEHEAGRGTQEVGSCLNKFIRQHLKLTATDLILWADSCGGQNRSIKMVLMLLHILHKHEMLEKVTLRFLHPGHTYLPNDSEFGDVECALKHQMRLYTVEDYINVMENCRRKKKFIVKRLQKDDFLSVAPIQERITNRKKDIEKRKISWITTFEIEVRKCDPTKLYMKTKLDETPKQIDISKGAKGRKCLRNFNMDLPILYPDGRELSEAKVKDLKEMLKLIPTDARPFYAFLRDVKSGDFIDDTEGFGNTIDFEINEEEKED